MVCHTTTLQISRMSFPNLGENDDWVWREKMVKLEFHMKRA